MTTRFSEDVIPLADLKTKPARVVRPATEAGTAEEREFMRAVVAGLADLEAGRNLSVAEALKRLGSG